MYSGYYSENSDYKHVVHPHFKHISDGSELRNRYLSSLHRQWQSYYHHIKWISMWIELLMGYKSNSMNRVTNWTLNHTTNWATNRATNWAASHYKLSFRHSYESSLRLVNWILNWALGASRELKLWHSKYINKFDRKSVPEIYSCKKKKQLVSTKAENIICLGIHILGQAAALWTTNIQALVLYEFGQFVSHLNALLHCLPQI